MKTKHIASAIIILALAACSTTAIEKVNAFFANPVVKTVISDATPILVNYAATGKFDQTAAIGAGLNAITDEAKQLNNPQLATLVQATVQTYTADPKGKTIGKDLARVVIASLPPNPTPQDKANAVAGVAAAAFIQSVPTAAK